MFRFPSGIVCLLIAMNAISNVFSNDADDAAKPTTSTVEPAIIQSAEEKYSSEVAKAEALVAKAEVELAKARKIANEARLKAYKDRLAEVTKTGDFDKAIAVKARIEQLEKEPEIDRSKNSSGIKILSATYGVNQSWNDVTDIVQEIVNKKKAIDVSDAA